MVNILIFIAVVLLEQLRVLIDAKNGTIVVIPE